VTNLVKKAIADNRSIELGAPGFPFPRVPLPTNGNPFSNPFLPEPAEVQVLAFLATANPLGFLAPDVPKPGFQETGTLT